MPTKKPTTTSPATPQTAWVPPTWYQEPLFNEPYDRLSMEITVHFDGPAGHTNVGYHIWSTDTRETIEMGTCGVIGTLQSVPELMVLLRAAHDRTLRLLSPF